MPDTYKIQLATSSFISCFLNQCLYEQISFLQLFRTSFNIFCKKIWNIGKKNICHRFSFLTNSSKHFPPLNHQNPLCIYIYIDYKEDYLLITSIIYAIYAFYFDNRMKLNEGYTTKLDHLLQKSIRYKHHYANYKESLGLDLIPAGLKIKKLPAITPVTTNFYSEWNEILHKAEKELVNLLLIESSKVVEKNGKRCRRRNKNKISNGL